MLRNNARVLWTIFAALFFIGAVLSCAGQPGQTAGGEIMAENTTSAEMSETSLLDTIPQINLDGATVRALARKNSWWQLTEISATELNGEVINDAFYNRNMKLEALCNIKFETEHVDAVGSTIRALIMADDDEYDFFLANMNESATLAADGLLLNLYSIPTLDMSNPAWDQNANDYFSIAGKLYYGVSDISLGKNEAIWCYMFNKKLIKDFSLDDPYKLVREGKWTFDVSHEMMAVVTDDINGDGKMTADTDRYGLATHELNYYAFLIAGGEPLARIGDEGKPVITAGSERFISVYDKIVSLFTDRDMTIMEYQGETFMAGRALLCGQVMACVRLFRPMEDDFGIIPMPKYDEAQERYYAYVIPYDIFSSAVPVTAEDPSVSGSVLQVLAILSAYYITPAYYDITITGKGLRDEESADMLDIILASTVYDLARMYDWGGLASGITGNIGAGRDFSSFFAKREKAANSALMKTLEAFEKNEN